MIVYSIPVFFDFTGRFPFQKQEPNLRPILIFGIFLKSAETSVSISDQNKIICRIRLKFSMRMYCDSGAYGQ